MEQRLTTLTGHLVEGVESGCIVLQTEDGRSFTLVGRAAQDVVGTVGELTVRGHLEPEMVSHCMQGPVFVITR
ncbi:MAG: hypothetical protein ABIP45_11495 [Knoellia sp.]